MNDKQTRATVIHGAAGLAAIVLPWWLGRTLGWPTPILIVVVLVVLGVVGVSAFRTLWESGRRLDPFPQTPPRPVVTAPIPPAAAAIGPFAIASGDDAYRFRFTATVHWQQKADDSPQDRNWRQDRAQEALLDRAIDAARTIAPHDHSTAGHRLAAALSEPLVAARAAVQVWASDVRVGVAEEDSERLTKLEQIQKDIRLWEQERAHEREIRRYLGEDALASSGTALVWWLARHEDDIRGAIERIPDLALISAVAQGPFTAEPMLGGEWTAEHRNIFDVVDPTDPGRDAAHSATGTAKDESWYGLAEPSTPADAARDLLDGLFPENNAERARAARHLALLVERWGWQDLAASLRGRNDIARDLDETSATSSSPYDRVDLSKPSGVSHADDHSPTTDQSVDEDNGSAGDPRR